MKLLVITLLCVLPQVFSHLSLTFPPARRYAMDFLDNVRTQPPCGGMAYDGSKTTLKTGTPIRFTWQSVYPHLGGIRFELLNSTTNEVIANLTGDDYLYTNDSTIRHHEMSISEDHICDHCILRLIRQAGEWPANVPGGYLFWSCADVSIKSPSDACYSGKCLNEGTCDSGTCNCKKTYTGDRCQYKNDCEDDEDCNNNGVCTDIESTYFPTKVCFCNPGKMGRLCSRETIPSYESLKTGYAVKCALCAVTIVHENIWAMKLLVKRDGHLRGAELCVLTSQSERSWFVYNLLGDKLWPECNDSSNQEQDGPSTSQAHGNITSGSLRTSEVCQSNCDKESQTEAAYSPISEAVKSADDLKEYYHSQLYGDPSYDLYWKMMDDEIEFVVQVKTNNWVGLGWRPNTATAECRNFPVNTAANGGSTPEGNPETAPEGTVEPETSPEGQARKRRQAEFEVMGKVVRRLKRETENNVLKDLCQAGNVTEAIAWAIRNYNADASSPVPEPHPEGEAPAPEGGTAEPETNAEGAATPEGEIIPTPEGGGAATPEGEAAATPEGEGTGEPEGEPEGHTPAFHAMDCQDIIIIAAEGNRHRILDSYTRDRSTPQPDSFFGGTDDLTAAAAARVDGVLHAVFRRKATSTDQADHSITDTPATVIWARGQDPVRVYHWPLTGMERCRASNYDFYKLNELKYHGTKASQRGSRTLNFFENPDGSESSSTGEERLPEGCTDACNYIATWSHNKEASTVTFTISARVSLGQWAAIGFSDDQNMINTDAVLVWMDDANSQPTISDRYITGKRAVDVSAAEDAENSQVTQSSYMNGMMTVSFSRPVDTEDDKDLSLNECRFLLYAWGGDVTSGEAQYHGGNRRQSSTSKICIASSSGRSAISNILSWSWVMCVFLISKFSN